MTGIDIVREALNYGYDRALSIMDGAVDYFIEALVALGRIEAERDRLRAAHNRTET